jgi:hypothetical protein
MTRVIVRSTLNITLSMTVALIMLLTLGAAGIFVHEDSLLWNCYLMGNHQCGDVSHLAGFILGK